LKHDIAWLEVIVNNFFLETGKIVQSTKHLLNDDFGLFLRNGLVLLDVLGQLRA